MKKFLLIAVMLFATACNVTPQPAPLNDKCVDLVARAAVSPVPVPGAYNCFDATTQVQLKTFHPPAYNDTDLAAGRLVETDVSTGAEIPISITPCTGLVKIDATTSKKTYEVYPTDPDQAKKYEHAVLVLKVSKPDSKVGVLSFSAPATCLPDGATPTPLS